ncbi:MAG: inositol-3-phosphate synthase [Planctomycetota bacterium]
MAQKKQKSRHPSEPKVGIWIFGALGGLATTLVTGTRAAAKGLMPAQGLLTESPLCEGLDFPSLGSMVFGGHEVRRGKPRDAAVEIHERTGTIPYPLLDLLEEDYRAYGKEIRKGVLTNSGRTIRKMVGSDSTAKDDETLLEAVTRLQKEIKSFKRRNDLSTVLCVNLCSTEPKLKLTRTHQTREGLEKAIAKNQQSTVRPSTLYAYAAASLGLPFLNFTPSNGTLIPAIREIFEQEGAPYMGSDGKTGETLVKSALAPMFKYRNLKVLSWQGYNILGDRDGAVLNDAENKASKVESKDRLLHSILGYPLHTHVGIDYVPSLDDLKTAWDFIHFQGFLGVKMSLQFTWQGADAVLAAPLILDLVRFLELAQKRGEVGAQPQLASFFKSPLDCDEHDLHRQWHDLGRYLDGVRDDSPDK